MLRADLGVGGRQLLVVSGTALPDYHVDSDETHRTECRVRLRVPAGTVEQATVTSGLASIGNDDTEWVFAVDESRVEVDAAGELVLVSHLAVMGEPSHLHRFSYQVVATTRIVVSEISGTLRWPTGWFRPASADPTAVAGRVTVVANRRSTTTTSSPFGPIITEHLVPVSAGQIVSVQVGEVECRAVYRISDPPLGEDLKVVATPVAFAVSGEVSFVPERAGGDVARLSPAQPVAEHVDFRTERYVGPA